MPRGPHVPLGPAKVRLEPTHASKLGGELGGGTFDFVRVRGGAICARAHLLREAAVELLSQMQRVGGLKPEMRWDERGGEMRGDAEEEKDVRRGEEMRGDEMGWEEMGSWEEM
jgi:hypothetical protein